MITKNDDVPADALDEEEDSVPSIDGPETNLHGEGDVAADRRYREGVASTIDTKDVEDLAKRARVALDGEEGEKLREAEERARRGPNTPPNP